MSVSPLITRPVSMMRAFLAAEAAGGIILIVAAALGMFVANSALSADYFHTLHIDLAGLSLLHWINDGLMALFFLIVGLEIKREVLDGQLARWPDRLLPGLAAAAGVIMPALIYVAINRGTPPAFAAGRSPPQPTSPLPSACSPSSAHAYRDRSRYSSRRWRSSTI